MADIPEPQVFGLSPVYSAYKGISKMLVLYAQVIFDTEMRNLSLFGGEDRLSAGIRDRASASLGGEHMAVLRGNIGLMEFTDLYFNFGGDNG